MNEGAKPPPRPRPRRRGTIASPQRRSVAAKIAKIEGLHGPGDERLPALREELDRLAVADIGDWARRTAAAMPPFNHDEIVEVGILANQLDARIARRAASDGPEG